MVSVPVGIQNILTSRLESRLIHDHTGTDFLQSGIMSGVAQPLGVGHADYFLVLMRIVVALGMGYAYRRQDHQDDCTT